MKQVDAINKLSEYERAKRYVFTFSDLAKIFHQDTRRTLRAGLERLIAAGVLVRACNGVYVYTLTQSKPQHVLEDIAKAVRRGDYSYVSLESALSEYGVISQVPVDRLTLMTTGRTGEFRTPFGTIEFTHTKRSVDDILTNTKQVGRPLRLATQEAAYRDLKKVNRNLNLVNEEALYES